MKKLYLLLFLSFSSTAFAQSPQANFLDKLGELFTLYNKKFPKEQVYLQLDKNYYQQGDSLWFKGYVLNRSSRMLSKLSTTLYTFLIDENSGEVLRQEFLISDGQVEGMIDLPKDMDRGYYKLVAFTNLMRNYNVEEIFSKDILLKEYTIPKNKYIKASFDKEIYQANESGVVTLSCWNSQKQTVRFTRLRCAIHVGNRVISKSETRAGKDGTLSFYFKLPEIIDSLPTIRVYADQKDFYDFFSVIPSTYKPKLDLQFFPEGGDAIANLSTKIAFKALNESNEIVNLKGEIVDSKGNLITKIESKTLGMGAFNLTPLANEKYKVRITEPQGYPDLVEFPQIKSDGYILSVENQNTTDVTVKIKSSQKGKPQKGYLVAQMMGDLVYSNPVELTDSVSLTIPTKELSMGIAQLTYFDETQIPQAERLVFLNKHKKVKISVENIKSEYDKREQVSLKIKATDEDGNPTRAVLSMAVADSILALSDNCEYENILASYTFRPYLKGKIHTPNFYFQNTKKADEALDVLLLTQGWRRFDWKNFTQEKISKLPAPQNFEMITGRVYDNYLTKKPSPKAKITITQLKKKAVNTLFTDENGKFSFMPTSNSVEDGSIVLMAKSKDGKDNVTMKLDKTQYENFVTQLLNVFRAYSYDAMQRTSVKSKPEENPIPKADPHFDKNTRLLSIVVVKAKPNKEEEYLSNPFYTTTRRGYQFKEESYFIDMLLQMKCAYSYDPMIGAVFVSFEQTKEPILITGRPEPTLFILNNRIYGKDYHELDFLDTKDIKTIKVISKPVITSMLYPFENCGAIVYITTKQLVKGKMSKNVCVPQGKNYATVRQFYAPKYDTEKSKEGNGDIRTTIHWKPFIGIGDSGETTVTFYNSDIAGTAIGTIEGVSAFGELGFCKFSYDVIKK